MPTFAVPEDDSSLPSNSSMGMDIEGDSFIAQVEETNRQKTEEVGREQVHKGQIDAYHVRAEQRIKDNAAKQAANAPNFRTRETKYDLTPKWTKKRTPDSLWRRDGNIPMLYTDLPPSTGKRKRDEYESQPPARDTYTSDSEPDMHSPAVRRVGGMVVTLCISAATWLAGIYNYLRGQNVSEQDAAQEQGMLAVETDLSGRKRRAVPNDNFTAQPESPMPQGSSSTNTSASNRAATISPPPGAFPSPSASSPESSKPVVEQRRNKTITKEKRQMDKTGDRDTQQKTEQPQQKTRANEKRNADQTAGTCDLQQNNQTPHATPSSVNPEKPILGRFNCQRGRPPPKERLPTAEERAEGADGLRKYFLARMPNLGDYGDTHPTARLEPTTDDVWRRFRRKWAEVGQDEYDLLVEEMMQARAAKDAVELEKWEKTMDRLKKEEEDQHEMREDEAEDGIRGEALRAAFYEKFWDGFSFDEYRYLYAQHALAHKKGECGDCWEFQKLHESEGLQFHHRGTLYAAEVAKETEEYEDNLKTGKGKSRAPEPTLNRRSSRPDAYARFCKQRHQRTSVAPTQLGKKEEDTRRPTTRSSHKSASYKGGLEPSPLKNAPGRNQDKPWSWDKTMEPGPSSLKSRTISDLKDKRVDNLINRSKQAVIQSPKDERLLKYVERRREVREATRTRIKHEKIGGRYRNEITSAKKEFEARRYIDEVRNGWAHQRFLEEHEKRQRAAEEEAGQKAIEDELVRKAAEEAERATAEDLSRQKAIEDELARHAAEEAAKQKAEAEEKARKDEGERLAAEGAAQADYERKQILIRPLDPAWDDRVKAAMANIKRDTILATAVEGATLTRRDFGTLLPQEGTSDDSSGWLNDEIINAMFQAIVQRKIDQTQRSKHHGGTVPVFASYNSSWYQTATSKKGVHGLDRWGRRKNIAGEKLFSCEKVFMPINTGAHWTLIIVSPMERKIEHLDSLHGKGVIAFKIAREWLEMELGEELYKPEEWIEVRQGSSKQANSDDCGVFTIMNGLAAAKGYPFSAVKAKDMQLARRTIAAILLNNGLLGDWEL